MKKMLCIVLCVMMVLSLFAGCAPEQQESTPTPTTKHVHKWADTWSSNETSHWKSCTGCSLQANMGAHMDDDLDGKCDDCGYEEACQHTFNEEKWMSDANNHWHPATCKHEGQKGALAAHTDENNDGICDVCQYFDENHQHTYDEKWSSDAIEHWHEATCDHDLVADKAAHDDLDNDGVCDTCKWYDQTHEHTFEEGWSVDAGHHWHGATCEHTGALQDYTLHDDQDVNGYCDTCDYLMCTHSDFNVDGDCDICGYENFEDPDHVHTYLEELAYNHNGHWAVGACHPGATTAVEAHVDKNNDGTCDTCAFVICSHTYKKSWSSDDTYHWYQLTCTCSVETRKDKGEHVDEDGIPGCDICMHGYQAPAPFEKVMENEVVTITPTGMITWQEVTIHIPQPGRYLISSDTTSVRWYVSKDQEVKPTSYASEMYFDEAGEVTLLAYFFEFEWATVEPFDIQVTMLFLDDLVLNTSRGKAELPTNMVYTVVFEAMEVGTWTLHTSVPNVAMGTTVDNMSLTTSVEVSVENPGDTVELYVLMQDDANNSSFVFDWELSEPFQLDVGVGMSPVSVPAEGDDYKVVFTAPEDGQFLLNVTSEYLSFSEWGLGGFAAPVRTESTQQLTPKMKAGDTFTTWIQPIYDYPMSTNINDTLTIINVGTILKLGASLTVNETVMDVDDLFKARNYYAVSDGALNMTVVNGKIGVVTEDGIQWYETEEVDGQQICEVRLDMQQGSFLDYYIRILDVTKDVTYTSNFEGIVEEETLTLADLVQDMTVYTAEEYGSYELSLVNGMIGVQSAQGQIQWFSAQDQSSLLAGALEAGESIRYYVLPVDESQEVSSTFSFQRLCKVQQTGTIYSFTAKEDSYYNISVVGGEIGITTNGVTQWVAPKEVDGQMVASYEVKVAKGETYVFQIRSESETVDAEINPVAYVIDMDDMKVPNPENPADGKKPTATGDVAVLTTTMAPGREYDLLIAEEMLNMKVTLTWDYKGVAVYVNGEVYKQGTEIVLREVTSFTAKLQNNVAEEVKFTLTVTYAPQGSMGEIPTEGVLELNNTVSFMIPAGGQALASYQAGVGGTYTLQCGTADVVICIMNEAGGEGDRVLSGEGTYEFQLEADETITFIIKTTNTQSGVVSLMLTLGSGK